MRILRWFLIFSSIAYWYSVFSMEKPLSQKKRSAEISTQILEEEAGINWQNLPIKQFYTGPNISALRVLSEQEIAQAVSNIITIANHAPDIQNAIDRVNKRFEDFPEISPLIYGPEIAKALAKQFKTHWLYVAALLRHAPTEDTLISYLDPSDSVPSEKLKAVKASLQLNDMNALYNMLKNRSYKQLFTRVNFGAHDVILSDLAKEGKINALKLLLSAGANINSSYMDRSLLKNAYPNLAMLSMLVEHGVYLDREDIFIRLLGTADDSIKNNKLYYPTLSAFIKAKPIPHGKLTSNDPNFNPLIIAVKAGNLKLFKWLLAQKEISNYLIGQAKIFITSPYIQITNKQLFLDQFAQ